ncbi:RING finger domain-containing protein [Endozoicomonas sp. 4G]|uniref:RING finger domain-containing protein n=1 Tax=Endozoicomonas sp. 4G TaxID=2872754 RepID=UPI0020784DCD|nr:RING finger domain-containing protein [Endozoicomonas sp. 4G]
MKLFTLGFIIILFSKIASCENCAICLEETNDNNEVQELCCTHRYHTNCLYRWANVKSICPVCKKNIHIHRDMFINVRHDLCSQLSVQGLTLNSISLNFELVNRKLQLALKNMATLGFHQFLVAEELERQREAFIREKRIREEREINNLCRRIKGLSIEDFEYDNPEPMEF